MILILNYRTDLHSSEFLMLNSEWRIDDLGFICILLIDWNDFVFCILSDIRSADVLWRTLVGHLSSHTFFERESSALVSPS